MSKSSKVNAWWWKINIIQSKIFLSQIFNFNVIMYNILREL